MDDAIKEILEYYGSQREKSSQETIVAMLRELQEVAGYLTPELKKQAAKTAEVKESFIDILVKRYPSLKEAAYHHVITACCGPRCGAKGGLELLEILKEELEIGKDGISRDGTVCLKTQNCLKQCKTAPNLLVDGILYPRIDRKMIQTLAAEWKKKG